MKQHERLNPYIEDAIKNFWTLPSLTEIGGETYSYKDVARKIAKLHILFDHSGIRKGDRVAICGRNGSNWCVTFFAVLTYGAVAVPILPDFKPDNLQHLLNHSESKLLFVDERIWEGVNSDGCPGLLGGFSLKDFSLLLSRDENVSYARAHLNELFGKKYPERFSPRDISYYKEDLDELSLISYTSGSTGFSKGVMLPYRSLWSNTVYCTQNLVTEPGDGVVCILPLAHMYGLTVDLIRSFVSGNHINILMRTPSPRIITEAMTKVKPKYVITVPLVLEKIIRTRIFPKLEKPLMKLLFKVPIVDQKLLHKINRWLCESFGGNLKEVMIGGAAINKDVEAFLDKCGFPLSAGYGMTETGPVITYAPAEEHRVGSCGRLVDRTEARIESRDPHKIPGVLWVKGDIVMQGYYKNPEATADAMTEDGWLCTGDICTIDNDRFIYIKGRDKNMILGPNGQNIYPEEIEDTLNNLPYVQESLIVDAGNGRLKALIVPDLESASSQDIDMNGLDKIMKENIASLNALLPSYSKVSSFRLQEEEFEKTPKKSIKRYYYKA